MFSEADSPDPFSGGLSPQSISRRDSINLQHETSKHQAQQPQSDADREPPKKSFSISIKEQLNKKEEEREDDLYFQESMEFPDHKSQGAGNQYDSTQTQQTQQEKDLIEEQLKQQYPNRYFIIKNLKENLAALARDLEYCCVASRHEVQLKSIFRVWTYSLLSVFFKKTAGSDLKYPLCQLATSNSIDDAVFYSKRASVTYLTKAIISNQQESIIGTLLPESSTANRFQHPDTFLIKERHPTTKIHYWIDKNIYIWEHRYEERIGTLIKLLRNLMGQTLNTCIDLFKQKISLRKANDSLIASMDKCLSSA